MIFKIWDRNAKVISESRNLRGVRERARKVPTDSVELLENKENGEGVLWIEFADGSYFCCIFASFKVLCKVARNWRSLYGSKLEIRQKPAGILDFWNKELLAVIEEV